MLELKGIKKDYPIGDGKVEALRGVDLSFRRSEFVSILGQSGCGKTTLLNIIGGLDGYTEGDLLINGVSTKEFKDKDWDTYRNHSVGFVFQSYNLIPHQTVLQNVEIALTLSGVSKAERRERAKKALEEVGLGDQLKKRPNEISGGQMQRVAIARALVNNPDIILADEPTGALDTETSVQVMEILKEISKDRLVIMVTHNPKLADKYSSRIIRMLDGKITDDSMPLSDEELKKEREYGKKVASESKKLKKPSMSMRTSFMLSLKNLFTKKGRTTLTAFAGSIGIIGIALILAVSQGTTRYINDVQESALSAYPLTLEASSVEMSSLMAAFMNVSSGGEGHEKDAVYKKAALYDMINAMNNIEERENDLASFNKYLVEELGIEDSDLKQAVNGVQYSYDLDLQIYTENVDGEVISSNLEEVIWNFLMKYMGIDMSAMSSMANMSPMASMSSSDTSLWQELLPGEKGSQVNDLLLNQYELAYGQWPNDYDEIVLILDENNELDDITLYALGLLSEEDIDKLANAALKDAELEEKEVVSWSYDEIVNRDYKVILNADSYIYDEETGFYIDLREADTGLRYLYDSAMDLKVTGIIRPREDVDVAILRGTIGYTSKLTEYLINKAKESDIIEAQMANPDIDIISGLPFDNATDIITDDEKEIALKEYLEELDTDAKAEAYLAIKSIPSEEFIQEQIDATLAVLSREEIETTMAEGMSEQVGVSASEISEYFASMSDEDITEFFTKLMEEQIKVQYAEQVSGQMSAMSPEELAGALTMEMDTFTSEQSALYYDNIIEFSQSTYEDNLLAMGYVDIESPAAINIYASSFENKDVIVEAIDTYNQGVDELQEIKYTDYFGIMMASITTIINAITYVLIAFVAISLIVSSIMIGVITLISVQERTKEIGILRAIGASKRDVSSMFNAETMIIGFASGVLGVVVTYLLCIPINAILHRVTGIGNLSAYLPVPAAIVLVIISVSLTLISGIIPSRSAAKKDPVIALRTE
mgnify:CR=1 FL=1